jgi:hypothetical protein
VNGSVLFIYHWNRNEEGRRTVTITPPMTGPMNVPRAKKDWMIDMLEVRQQYAHGEARLSLTISDVRAMGRDPH